MVKKCGTVCWNSGTVWWKSVEECGGTEQQWNSVSGVGQCGGTLEQCCGTVEQCGGREEQCGTVWWNSVKRYGEKVWNSMLEQWDSVVEECGRVWWNRATVEQCGGTV